MRLCGGALVSAQAPSLVSLDAPLIDQPLYLFHHEDNTAVVAHTIAVALSIPYMPCIGSPGLPCPSLSVVYGCIHHN